MNFLGNFFYQPLLQPGQGPAPEQQAAAASKAKLEQFRLKKFLQQNPFAVFNPAGVAAAAEQAQELENSRKKAAFEEAEKKKRAVAAAAAAARAASPPPAASSPVSASAATSVLLQFQQQQQAKPPVSPSRLMQQFEKEDNVNSPSSSSPATATATNMPRIRKEASAVARVLTPIAVNVDPFDPQRQNLFLLEWRPTKDGALYNALTKGQELLKKAGGTNITFPQSCGADNQHATLAEFKVRDPALLPKLKLALQEFAQKRIPQIAKSSAGGGTCALVPGLQDFRDNVLFLEGKSPYLDTIFMDVHAVLHSVGIIDSPLPKRTSLTIHFTLGRLQNAGMLSSLKAIDFFVNSCGGPTPITDDGEIVFCCKRYGAEPTPPVIMQMSQ